MPGSVPLPMSVRIVGSVVPVTVSNATIEPREICGLCGDKSLIVRDKMEREVQSGR